MEITILLMKTTFKRKKTAFIKDVSESKTSILYSFLNYLFDAIINNTKIN